MCFGFESASKTALDEELDEEDDDEAAKPAVDPMLRLGGGHASLSPPRTL